MKHKLLMGLAVSVLALVTACENQDIEYPDFEYQTVYFSNQYPVRTLELGEDDFVDVSLDNERKVKIVASLGGTRSNAIDRVVHYEVVNSFCDGLVYADDNTDIVAMPSDYYTLSSDRIVIPAGQHSGGVEVSLTDKFFEDPLTLTRHYVIPVLLTSVESGDSILSGYSTLPDANRFSEGDWVTAPQDYVLYAVKYVNPWHGVYLRHGVDVVTKEGETETVARHEQYVEDDELVDITTLGLKQSLVALTTKDDAGKDIPFNLKLTFDDDNNCTVASNSPDDYEVNGTGKFVLKGEKNSFGGKDRNALYLNYEVVFKQYNNMTYRTIDTLVVQTRNVIPEYFTVSLK